MKSWNTGLDTVHGLYIQLSTNDCFHTYEGESNDNLKYFLSHNLMNTKGAQWLHFFYVVSIDTCRPIFYILLTVHLNILTYLLTL